MLLYGIQMGLKINVGGWINSDICHTIRQGLGGIFHPTLIIELIASHGINTTNHEVLQAKGASNPKAIERISSLDLRQEAIRASSSGARAPRPAHTTQTRATIADLTRAVELYEAQLHGMRNWMAAKAAYDHRMGEAMCVRLDALIMRYGVDPTTMPEVPTYLENLTRPWEAEEPRPPYGRGDVRPTRCFHHERWCKSRGNA